MALRQAETRCVSDHEYERSLERVVWLTKRLSTFSAIKTCFLSRAQSSANAQLRLRQNFHQLSFEVTRHVDPAFSRFSAEAVTSHAVVAAVMVVASATSTIIENRAGESIPMLVPELSDVCVGTGFGNRTFTFFHIFFSRLRSCPAPISATLAPSSCARRTRSDNGLLWSDPMPNKRFLLVGALSQQI